MLFVHQVAPEWRDRIPAVVHVDGTARVQTVDREHQPLVAAMLDGFAARTGLPVIVNTSLNTGGPAHGGRPAGRAGMLRLRAGGRAGPGAVPDPPAWHRAA